jgi:hypothetical protein
MADLSEAKPGDYLLITRLRNDEWLEKIERVTNTQVIVASGLKYRRKDGKRIAEQGWARSHAKLATPQEVRKFQDRAQAMSLRRDLTDMIDNRQRNWTPSILQQVKDLLESMEMQPEART